jgi:hypothetical protein
MSMAMWHCLSPIHILVIKQLSLLLSNTLSVKQGDESDGTGGSLFTLALTCFLSHGVPSHHSITDRLF